MLFSRVVGRVRILAPSESERIAAGEVIERPASVARELVENSLDAGATRIEVDLSRGGLGEVRVVDDGEGMAPDDALASLRRHATFKIECLEDLGRLSTLGFRGEALPSIAAVSRMELLTATGAGGEGTRIRLEGGGSPVLEPAARARGTTVAAADLFFNTPARRKFLKSPSAEFSRLSDVLVPEMLAHPEVGFVLRHDGREAVAAPPAAALRERLAGLWGADLAERLLLFEANAGAVQVHGFVSGPDDSRASRRGWYVLVNGRPVRDRMLNHAVMQGMGGALPKGRFPVLVLQLDLPAGAIDVNVHPAKSEVRFAEPNRVHGVIVRALEQATRPRDYVSTAPRPVAETTRSPAGSAPIDRWQVAEAGGPGTGPDLFGTSVPEADRPEPGAGPADGRVLVVLAQYRECFILAHDADALYLIDQHVAHERTLYEAFRRDLGHQGADRQSLLFPRTVELGPGRGQVLREVAPVLERLGFDVEAFGEDAALLRTVPAFVGEGQAVAAFGDVLEILADQERPAGAPGRAVDRVEHLLAATVACHAAVKIHFPLTSEKMEYLVSELFRCAEPLTCPHGRRVVARWSHDDLLRTFGRA